MRKRTCLIAGIVTSIALFPHHPNVTASFSTETLAQSIISEQETISTNEFISKKTDAFTLGQAGTLYEQVKVVHPKQAKHYLLAFKNRQRISDSEYEEARKLKQAEHVKLYGKKTPQLHDKLKQAGHASKWQVGIWTQDISAQNQEKITKDLRATFQGELAQMKDETRFSYRTERISQLKQSYQTHQASFAQKLDKLGVHVHYQSGIAPFFLIEATPTQIKALEQDPHVLQLDIHIPEVTLSAMTSITDIRADITRDTYGTQGIESNGSATRIAVCEPADGDGGRGVAFTSPYLAAAKGGVYNPNTSLYSNHATFVAGIIANNSTSNKGIVPKAKLYDATWVSGVTGDEYKAIEWAISQGVEVINQSYGGNTNSYDLRARWMDHIAVYHSVHVVAAGGNDPSQTTPSPAIAYNIVGVGAISDQGDNNQWNDTWYMSGTYKNVFGGPNKPDLAAPGVSITSTNRDGGFSSGWSGTSFAAPHVTGVIGQMIGANSSLAVRQAGIKAILMAGAYRHATDVNDLGFMFTSTSLSDKDGAGVIDALNSYQIIKDNQWRVYSTGTFPISVPFTVTPTSQRNRVAISWLKKNSVVEGTSTPTMGTETPLADLDLYIYDPSGNVVGYSTAGPSSVNNNYELVEFLPKVSGTYTLKIVGFSNVNNPEYVGVAWW